MTYRKEASIRVAAFCAAFVISLIIAAAVGVLLALLSSKASDHSRGLLIGWGFMIAFVISCAVAVYYTDQRLDRKFSDNP